MIHQRSACAAMALAISACVVTTGPRPAQPPPPPPSAPPPTLASSPPPAPPPAPVPAATVQTAPPAAVQTAPPAQPVFAPTPEPADRPIDHPRGFGRGGPRGLNPGHPESFWVWHEDNGTAWHLRSTTHRNLHRFSGRVWTSDGSIVDVHPTRLEWGDRIRLAGRNVEFDFHTDGGVDGFDFRTAAPQQCVHFALFIDGRGDPARIKIGGGEQRPRHHVFTLCP